MYDLDLLDEYETLELRIDCPEIDPEERLVTAALLTATAFRMKDGDGLVTALRTLVAAVSAYDTERRLAA
ncbi:MAG: hypothetical protein ACOCYE_05630 [Pseudomonadota bacterium]